MSTVSKFGSLCFTIRPKGGLTGDLETALKNWIIKQPFYAYNIEMEDEARHLHCQVFYPEKKSKGDLTKALFRIQSKYDIDWSPASKKVLSSGVKVAYNDKFLEYMMKDNPLIECCIPEDTSIFYPSEEEQLRVQRKSNSVNTRYDHYKDLFLKSEFYSEDDHEYDKSHITGKLRVANWLAHVMFKEKSITVVQDSRLRQQIINSLTFYVYDVSGYELLSEKDKESIRIHRVAIDNLSV